MSGSRGVHKPVEKNPTSKNCPIPQVQGKRSLYQQKNVSYQNTKPNGKKEEWIESITSAFNCVRLHHTNVAINCFTTVIGEKLDISPL